MIPSASEILSASKKVQSVVHRTPVVTSKLIDEISGASLFFKCENMQRAGSFKIRGATNAVLSLSSSEKEKGVVTHSSGNFAQGLALAALEIGVKAYIVMPENAPKVKIEAVKGYGAKVILCKPTLEDREKTAIRIQQDTQATFIHPYNNIKVVIGHTSAAHELFEDVEKLDYLLAPVGGGGLISGMALAAHYNSTSVRVIGTEPELVNDAYRSFKAGRLLCNTRINTIADGLRTNLGDITFPIIHEFLDDIICVKENEIIAAMKLIYERLKLVVEPSSAVPLAAILSQRELFENKRVGIILSGGNIDLSKLPF